MKSLSRFESNLVQIVRCFVGRVPLRQAMPLVFQSLEAPSCLSRDCVELVQETLSKGMLQILAREGWQRERFLQNDKVVSGRLWERHSTADMALAFSPATLEWLIWTTAHPPARRPRDFEEYFPRESLTVGDQLLLFLAFAALNDTLATPKFLKLPHFAQHGLLWLAFAEQLGMHKAAGEPDFGTWTQPSNAWILELLQPMLATSWYNLELAKQQVTSWQHIQSVGRVQERALTAFLDALEAAGRWDLSRFLLQAALSLFESVPPQHVWFRRLDLRELRIADRTEVYHAGCAFLRVLERLRGWEQNARTIGFYDEGYTASQLWKSDWERLRGNELCERAQAAIGTTALWALPQN